MGEKRQLFTDGTFTNDVLLHKKVSVSLIPKKKYDSAPKAQKEFFDKLISEGRMIITDGAKKDVPEIPTPEETTQNTTVEAPKQKTQPYSLVNRFIGKRVCITFHNGEVLCGKLDSVWMFDMAIEDGVRSITVMKQAIRSIQQDGAV